MTGNNQWTSVPGEDISWQDGRPYFNPQGGPPTSSQNQQGRLALGPEALFRITQYISINSIHRMNSNAWKSLLTEVGVNPGSNGHELALTFRYEICNLINEEIRNRGGTPLDPDAFLNARGGSAEQVTAVEQATPASTSSQNQQGRPALGPEALFRIIQHISISSIHRMNSNAWRDLLTEVGVNPDSNGHELALTFRHEICNLINEEIRNRGSTQLDPDAFLDIRPILAQQVPSVEQVTPAEQAHESTLPAHE